MMGMVECEFRMPLCEMMNDNKVKLEEVIREYRLI